jgi:hypothetical protein
MSNCEKPQSDSIPIPTDVPSEFPHYMGILRGIGWTLSITVLVSVLHGAMMNIRTNQQTSAIAKCSFKNKIFKAATHIFVCRIECHFKLHTVIRYLDFIAQKTGVVFSGCKHNNLI